MKKYIPYEKLSKTEKKKRNTAKRIVWAISPVTRRADNPKAYKRSRIKDSKNDMDPYPASVLLTENDKQKKNLKCQRKYVQDPEIGMFSLVMKGCHSEQCTGRSSEKTKDEKSRFRDTPGTGAGFVFIDSISEKGDQGHKQQKCGIKKCVLHGKPLSTRHALYRYRFYVL